MTLTPAEQAQADSIRRKMIDTNQAADDLVLDDGPTWNTQAMQAEFEVVGFSAPFVVVIRKRDGVKGTLEFTHSPRTYFGWSPA